MIDVYSVFEIIGTIAFAISGATTAIKKELDLLGVIVLGMVTAVGGGVLRDVIGNVEPAIFSNTGIVWLAFFTAFLTFVIAYISLDIMEKKYFFWLFTISDAIGLAVFTIFGCQKMLVEYDAGTAVFFGVLTGVGGGLIRDILAGQTPYVLSKHFYASSCIVGALIYILIRPYRGSLAVFLGVVSVFISRMLAVRFRWNLPKIKKMDS
jgi:uncharacterized membrane protein YeiH